MLKQLKRKEVSVQLEAKSASISRGVGERLTVVWNAEIGQLVSFAEGVAECEQTGRVEMNRVILKTSELETSSAEGAPSTCTERTGF